MLRVLLLLCLLCGCSDPYVECIEQQKSQYRSLNPNASYGQVLGKLREFELTCSKLTVRD